MNFIERLKGVGSVALELVQSELLIFRDLDLQSMDALIHQYLACQPAASGGQWHLVQRRYFVPFPFQQILMITQHVHMTRATPSDTFAVAEAFDVNLVVDQRHQAAVLVRVRFEGAFAAVPANLYFDIFCSCGHG